ncbi:DNA polymerase III, delta subunit [Faunimonas pinastri]|uniref:DNA-directed DNA polymerase n=1 Tax=Faunimonas pinastri TaxID=1855383 RepID=A0A1H9GVE7_9HYPH|nr:DNA polymerase III subunit delta [Faunimonas pinastri]SEQ54082.1 DNA polymerase III, delta subunit [Faunimonas pinastri]
MTTVDAAGADRYVASPPPGIRIFLLYGPDAGAVTERARVLEAVARLRDPAGGSVVRIGTDEISGNPGRLADEIFAVSLFGGEPIVTVRLSDGRVNLQPAVEPLLKQPLEQGYVIIEAGDLKNTSPLRKGVEGSGHAAAIPCYESDARGVTQQVQQQIAEAGQTIEPDALELVAGSLGGDRLVTRSEVAKLLTYAGEESPIRLEHVEAVIRDSLESRTDQIIDAAMLGRAEVLEASLERLRLDGSSPSALAAQALRHLLTLHGLRTEMETGARARDVVSRARPPIFFKRRGAVEETLSRWSLPDLRRARSIVGEAVSTARRQPALEMPAVSDALYRIAGFARRAGRGR